MEYDANNAMNSEYPITLLFKLNFFKVLFRFNPPGGQLCKQGIGECKGKTCNTKFFIAI